jgi:hypothetical protein
VVTRRLSAAQQEALTVLVEKGRLLRVAPDAVRATLFLERAADTLADLPHLKLPQNRYNLAYDAAHAVGEAMLARHGYRTANGPGQHAALADFLRIVFVAPPWDEAGRHVERMRRTRNQLHYEARTVGAAEADKAVAVATTLLGALQVQAYEYLPITRRPIWSPTCAAAGGAQQGITFSDAEWERFFSEKHRRRERRHRREDRRIQEDHVQVLKRDDGTTKNIYLIDKANIHNNRLQVINQYEVEGKRANRYDVTVLVNGLPMVHIELKRRAWTSARRSTRSTATSATASGPARAVRVRAAVRHQQRHADQVLQQHRARRAFGRAVAAKRGKSKTSNSFEFTSWWADAKNQPITELAGFTKTFFAKHTLLNILTRYCVFDVDRKLLVMRPYQIVAAERILQRIATSTNHKQLGTLAAGGYIWHTTGSGKTLTSFKARNWRAACRTSTRCCSWWTARIWTTRPCASTSASRRARPTPTRPRRAARSSWKTRTRASSSPRSRSCPASSPRTRSTRSTTRTWW